MPTRHPVGLPPAAAPVPLLSRWSHEPRRSPGGGGRYPVQACRWYQRHPWDRKFRAAKHAVDAIGTLAAAPVPDRPATGTRTGQRAGWQVTE